MELTQFVFDSLPIKRKNTDGILVSPMVNIDGHRKYRDEKPSVDRRQLNIEKQSGKIIIYNNKLFYYKLSFTK